jgi:cytochrome c556
MPKLAYRLVSGALVATAISGLVAVALAADVIKERQEIMKTHGDALRTVAAMVQKRAPFDQAVVKTIGEELAESLARVKEMFPEGSDKGETETWAKPEIWQNKEAFDQGFDQAIEAAKKLAAVEQEAELLPALNAVGTTCKNCHDRFQRPK